MIHDNDLPRLEFVHSLHATNARSKRAKMNWNMRRIDDEKSLRIQQTTRKIESVLDVCRHSSTPQLFAHISRNRTELRCQKFVGAYCTCGDMVNALENHCTIFMCMRLPTSRNKCRRVSTHYSHRTI